MKQKILGSLVALILFYGLVNWYIAHRVVGAGVEGLFKTGHCLRDEEFGITYKVRGTAKDRTMLEVVQSDKYPTQEQYRVGALEHISSNENPRKLYAVACR